VLRPSTACAMLHFWDRPPRSHAFRRARTPSTAHFGRNAPSTAAVRTLLKDLWTTRQHAINSATVHAPSTPATMSKQHCRMLQVERFFRQSHCVSTLSTGRNFVRHFCRFFFSKSMHSRKSACKSFDALASANSSLNRQIRPEQILSLVAVDLTVQWVKLHGKLLLSAGRLN